jgi:hypothetical protein
MAKNADVETKPPLLRLHDARPRGRSAPNPQAQPTYDAGFQFPFPGGYNYPNPYMMPPMPMPMLYNQGLGQNPGSHPFLAQQYPVPVPSTQAINSRPTSIEYPEVTRWFRFLDEHEERSKDGIHFAPYGDVLKDKGFLRITQLTLDFVTLQDLQAWLDIEVGIAILIMQYAKEDVEGIKAGTLVIP